MGRAGASAEARRTAAYNHPLAIRARVEAMEALLERSVSIPGFERKIGLDAIVGLVPVVGDWIAAAMSAYIIWEGKNLGMSKWQLARMAGNTGFDTLIGMIPIAGDLFDFVFRSNTRNLKIIKAHLDRHHPGTMTVDAAPVSPAA